MAYFCAVRPRQRPPAELINGVRNEDHRYSSNARRSSGTSIGVWRGSGVVHDRDNDETHRHEQGGDPQRRLAAPALREEDDKSCDGDELLGTEQTSNEQVLVAATDEELEELRREVGERCHAGRLLAEEDSKSDCKTLLVRWLQQFATLEAFACTHLLSDTSFDLGELSLDFWPCQTLLALPNNTQQTDTPHTIISPHPR